MVTGLRPLPGSTPGGYDGGGAVHPERDVNHQHDLCAVLDDASSGGELIEHDIDEGHGDVTALYFVSVRLTYLPLCSRDAP